MTFRCHGCKHIFLDEDMMLNPNDVPLCAACYEEEANEYLATLVLCYDCRQTQNDKPDPNCNRCNGFGWIEPKELP